MLTATSLLGITVELSCCPVESRVLEIVRVEGGVGSDAVAVDVGLANAVVVVVHGVAIMLARRDLRTGALPSLPILRSCC